MTKFTTEYLAKVRVCAHLIEPPAAEVIGELCDEISRLTAEVETLQSECRRLNRLLDDRVHGIWNERKGGEE